MQSPSTSDRLESVDLLRGVVIIIMALDHVRDFFSERLMDDPTDLKTTTAAIFLTRWITHYCAPTFIFLAGTGAFLSGQRGRSRPELAWFLFTRGLWLVFIELTIVRASWWFNWSWHDHGAGVFWAIGWSMVILSWLIYLPLPVITAIGVGMIALHNKLDGLTAEQVGLPRWLWIVLHSPGGAPVVGRVTFGTGYCLIPWVGVMAAGYGFGRLLVLERPVRRACLFQLGASLILGFVILRLANVYGDPRPWAVQYRPCLNPFVDEAANPQQSSSSLLTLLSFLNCTKYPPSLLYLLMTLGPAILFLAIFDRPLGVLAKPVITFGRVPLFFYLLHIPLIHGGAVLLDVIRFGWSPQADDGPWSVDPKRYVIPDNYGVSLTWVYAIWIAVVLILYPLCHWFAGVKRRSRSAWLSYL